jgi:uncharacterized membrane protein
MAEWRFARGWTESELARRLLDAALWRRNIDVPDWELTPSRGWNLNRSEAVIAREPGGAPRPDGAFARAWELIDRYAFSDPRIVKGHFDVTRPLLGRRMLLEARVLGLHYLGAVAVTDVRFDEDAGRTVRGFRYDTLEGHFERGYEWFLLEKDHRSGVVTFRIEAAWQRGELPNAWSRLGFHLLARHYQRAWHRLAYQRLRIMLGSVGLAPLPRGRGLVHEGPALRVGRVHELGSARPHDEIATEHDVPADPSAGAASNAAHRSRAFAEEVTALGLGAVTGARTMLAPALMAIVRPDVLELTHGTIARMLRLPMSARVLAVLAVGELSADKTPWIPARTGWLPLAGRVAVGTLVGALVAKPGRRSTAAATGAAGAAAATHVLSRLRRRATEQWAVPNVIAGAAEDALAVVAGVLLLRRLR